MSFLGGIIGGITKVASFIPGPVGLIAGVANRALTGGAPAAAQPSPYTIGGGAMLPGGTIVGGAYTNTSPFGGGGASQLPFQPVNFGAPQQPGTGVVRTGGNTVISPMGTSAQVPKGYHINRAIVAMDGMHGRVTPSKQRRAAQVIQTVVKNRHLNPLNVHALRRAERRAHGFLRIARKLVRHYVAKQPKGKAFISTRRKKK